ncbi:hypothetical protein BaRGS_00036161, partial [Batillaria attramentaria]
MAAAAESTCHSDPNFAVICSFLEKYGELLGLPEISFTELQEYLEDTKTVSRPLIDLHVRLLKRIGKSSVNHERFERSVTKFCFYFSDRDGWEVERFGYRHAQLSTKLRVLKNLLECQFDYNVKFKEKINEMGAEEMRFLPAGRDRDGMTYWYLLDKDLNVFVYREEPDDENAESWKLLCSDRFQLAQLVDRLRNNTQRNFLEEDEDTKSSIFTDESKSTSKEGSPDREQKPPDKGSSVKVETDSVKCETPDNGQASSTTADGAHMKGETVKTESGKDGIEADAIQADSCASAELVSGGIKVKIKTEPGHEECVDTKDGETGKDAVCDKALDQADTMTDSPKGKERTKKKKKRSEASDSPVATAKCVPGERAHTAADNSDSSGQRVEKGDPAARGKGDSHSLEQCQELDVEKSAPAEVNSSAAHSVSDNKLDKSTTDIGDAEQRLSERAESLSKGEESEWYVKETRTDASEEKQPDTAPKQSNTSVAVTSETHVSEKVKSPQAATDKLSKEGKEEASASVSLSTRDRDPKAAGSDSVEAHGSVSQKGSDDVTSESEAKSGESKDSESKDDTTVREDNSGTSILASEKGGKDVETCETAGPDSSVGDKGDQQSKAVDQQCDAGKGKDSEEKQGAVKDVTSEPEKAAVGDAGEPSETSVASKSPKETAVGKQSEEDTVPNVNVVPNANAKTGKEAVTSSEHKVEKDHGKEAGPVKCSGEKTAASEQLGNEEVVTNDEAAEDEGETPAKPNQEVAREQAGSQQTASSGEETGKASETAPAHKSELEEVTEVGSLGMETTSKTQDEPSQQNEDKDKNTALGQSASNSGGVSDSCVEPDLKLSQQPLKPDAKTKVEENSVKDSGKEPDSSTAETVKTENAEGDKDLQKDSKESCSTQRDESTGSESEKKVSGTNSATKSADGVDGDELCKDESVSDSRNQGDSKSTTGNSSAESEIAGTSKQVEMTEKNTVSEMEKSTVSETEISTVSETEKSAVSETEKSTVSEKEKSAVSETEKTIVSEKEKTTVNEKEKTTDSEKKKTTVSEKEKCKVSEKEKVRVSEKLESTSVENSASADKVETAETVATKSDQSSVELKSSKQVAGSHVSETCEAVSEKSETKMQPNKDSADNSKDLPEASIEPAVKTDSDNVSGAKEHTSKKNVESKPKELEDSGDKVSENNAGSINNSDVKDTVVESAEAEKDREPKTPKAKRRRGKQPDEPKEKTVCNDKDSDTKTRKDEEPGVADKADDSKQSLVNGHAELAKESDELEDIKDKKTPARTPSKRGRGRGGARGRGRGRGGSRVTKRVAPEPESEETNSEPAEKRAKRGGRRGAANSRGRGNNAAAKQGGDSGSSSDSDVPISRYSNRGRGRSRGGRGGGAAARKTNNKKKNGHAGDASSSSSDDLPLSKAAKKKKIVGEDSSDFEPEEPVVPAKKGRVGNKSKKAKATPSAKEPETALYNTRRSLRIQTMKKKEPEPEFELSSEGVQSGDTSSEASLQSEDDTEDDFSPQGRNRQRQAALKKKEEEEVPVDDTPCKICDKCTHPDMMLLCDSCDAGHHMACLRPPLMAIPEGDWFCPPCEHAKLIEKLAEYLHELETTSRKKDRLVRRKERLAFVGISLDNILKEHSHRSGHGHKRDKRGESDGSPLPEEVYAKRSCRQRSSVSYQFKEYDELITAAIEEDVRAPKPPKPPGRSRGKDMSNILGMDSDEEKELRRKEKEEEMAASEATQDGAPPPVVKKKPRRRLTTLDSDENQEDEDDSGDEFQLSESDEDSEASAELSQDEEASEDSGDWRPQRTWFNRAAARRSSRTKGRRGNWSRYDQDFVVDDEYDSDEEASKRRSTRNSSRRKVRYRDWESDSESEALETEESEASFSEVCSDDSEVRRKKRNKNKKPRKKFASDSESDSSGSEYMVRKSRAKKRRVASSESEEEAAPRKTSKLKSASKTKSTKSPQKLKSQEEEKTHADDNDYGEDEDTEVEDEKEKSVGKEKEASQEKEIVKDDNKAEGKIEPLAENALAEESAPQEKGVGKKAKQSKGKKGKGRSKKADSADEPAEKEKPLLKDSGTGTTEDNLHGEERQGEVAVDVPGQPGSQGVPQSVPNFLGADSKPQGDPSMPTGGPTGPPPFHGPPEAMHPGGEVGFRPPPGMGFRPPMEGGFHPPHDGRFPPDGTGFRPDQMGFRPPFPHGPYPLPGEQMQGSQSENFNAGNAGNYFRPPGMGPFSQPGPRGPQSGEGFRPPHGAEGFQPPHGPEGFRPPHSSEGFRPPQASEGFRPGQGPEGFRPPPQGSEGFRPPQGSEGFRPPREGFAPRGPEGFRPLRPESFHPGGPYPPFHRPPQQFFPPGQPFQGHPPPGYGMYPHQFPPGPGQGQYGPGSGPHPGAGQYHPMMPPVSQVPGGPPPGRGGFMIDNLLRNNSAGPSF